MLVVVFACHDLRHMSAAHAHKVKTHEHTLGFSVHSYTHAVFPDTQRTQMIDFHCTELHDPGTVCVCVKAQ